MASIKGFTRVDFETTVSTVKDCIDGRTERRMKACMTTMYDMVMGPIDTPMDRYTRIPTPTSTLVVVVLSTNPGI